MLGAKGPNALNILKTYYAKNNDATRYIKFIERNFKKKNLTRLAVPTTTELKGKGSLPELPLKKRRQKPESL